MRQGIKRMVSNSLRSLCLERRDGVGGSNIGGRRVWGMAERD